MNIFVGNLPYQATDEDLRKAAEAFGEVSSASVIIDKFTGKSRGFGFIEMPNQEQGQAAVDGLNESDLHGRNIRVNEARPREERPPRSGGGGFGGGGGGGYGGGGGRGYGGGGGGGRGGRGGGSSRGGGGRDRY